MECFCTTVVGNPDGTFWANRDEVIHVVNRDMLHCVCNNFLDAAGRTAFHEPPIFSTTDNMMMKEDVFKQIQQLLIDTFELDETAVSLDAHIYQDLDLDSFDAIDLAVSMGAETGVKLEEEDLRAIRTVGDIVDIVHKKWNA